MSFVQLWPPELDRCAADAPVWWAFELVSAQSTERKQHGEKRRHKQNVHTSRLRSVFFFARIGTRFEFPVWPRGRRSLATFWSDRKQRAGETLMTLLRALQRLCSLRWRRHLWSVGVFAVFLVGRVGGQITTDSSASQWIFLPGGHRAKRSLDRPSRVPQKWHFSWFPTHFPLLCCSRLSLLPHPASHWAPIFIPPLSPALVKQTGCCLPCGSLSFFFFFPSIWSISNPFQGSSAVQQPQNAARTVYLPLFVSPALTADGLGWGCNSGWTHPAWIIYTLQMNNAQRVKVKEIERGLSVGVLDAGGASNGFQIRSPIWACFRPRGVCELYIFSSSWHSSESRRLKARTLTLPFPLTATAAAVFFFGLFCFGL